MVEMSKRPRPWRCIDALATQCSVRSTIPFLIALALLPSPAFAQSLSDENAVQAGKDALSGVSRFPWYDRRRDEVRRLHVVPRDAADSENRGSKWINNSVTTATGTTPRINMLGAALQWVGLTTLVILLGVIAFLIAKAFLKEEVTENAAVRKVVESARDVDRIESLPFKIRGAPGDFLGQARRLYEAGSYSEAIIYLFSYQLVQLDKHHLIRLAKGKTNRQYLREIRQRPNLRSILEATMISFEDAFFGRKALSKDRFESCWQRLDEFHHELEHHERAAA
jgi:hypothetical protein